MVYYAQLKTTDPKNINQIFAVWEKNVYCSSFIEGMLVVPEISGCQELKRVEF